MGRKRDQREGGRRAGDAEREHGCELVPDRAQPAGEPALQEDDHERHRAEDGDGVGPCCCMRAVPELAQQQPSEQEGQGRRHAEPARERLQRERGRGRTAGDCQQQRELVRAHPDYPRASARLMAETTARRLAVTMLWCTATPQLVCSPISTCTYAAARASEPEPSACSW